MVCTLILLTFLGHSSKGIAQAHPHIGAPASIGLSDSVASAISRASIGVSTFVTPMVVSVSVVPGKIDDKRLQYLEDYMRSYGRRFKSDKYRRRLTASGVLITGNGYVLTNHHVIDESHEDSILVQLKSGESFHAELVGSDPLTDLAVLRIYGEGFPVPHFGNSDSLAVGQWVIAVGNPLDLVSTVTAGIISAVGRESRSDDEDEFAIADFLQTDAAINPGNSGGGLFDLEGNLIGINSASFTGTGYFIGYGLAIPSNIARVIAEDLIEDGKINRGYLGIAVSKVTESQLAQYGLKSFKAVIVDEVDKKSPAFSAGLKERDIITAINGHDITSYTDLQARLGVLREGAQVVLSIFREGSKMEVTAVLGMDTHKPTRDTTRWTPSKGSIGVVGREVTVEESGKLGLSSTNGLMIDSVKAYGTASKAGIAKGDVLLEINSKKVFSKKGFDEMTNSLKPGEQVTLVFWRKDKQLTSSAVVQPMR